MVPQTAIAIHDADDDSERVHAPCVGEAYILGIAVELIFYDVSFVSAARVEFSL